LHKKRKSFASLVLKVAFTSPFLPATLNNLYEEIVKERNENIFLDYFFWRDFAGTGREILTRVQAPGSLSISNVPR